MTALRKTEPLSLDLVTDRIWTPRAEADLVRLWNEGLMSAERIAKHLHGIIGKPVTRKAVLSHVGKLRARGVALVEKTTASKIVEVVDTTGPSAITLETWPTAKECNWPIGHPGKAGFRFCRAERGDHRLYCTAHVKVAYRSKDEDR